jgi:hypothetical protein
VLGRGYIPPRRLVSLSLYYTSALEVIGLVLMYVRFLPLPRNVKDLLIERDPDFCHEAVRLHAEGRGQPR